MKIEVSR